VPARQGFMTLEAALGAALLLFTFFGIISIYFILWEQLKAEQLATTLVRSASRESQVPGSARDLSVLDGRGAARVTWGQDYVSVRVETGGGRAAAQRLLPREVP